MRQGIFFEPGEGMEVTARGSSMVFKAISETTDGAFSLMERVLPVSNRRPQLHVHQGFVELQALWGREEPPTPVEESDLMRRHGLEPAVSE